MTQSQGRGGRTAIPVARCLDGIAFPASREDLIRHARHHEADDEVLELLGDLPNRDYGSMADVMKGVRQRPP